MSSWLSWMFASWLWCNSFWLEQWPFFCNWIIYFFLNISMVLETLMKLCVTAKFLENIFVLKIGELGQKQVFLNLYKYLVIYFYWICYKRKIYIICCVPAQIPCLEKILSLRYRPKCFQPIRLQDIFKSTMYVASLVTGLQNWLYMKNEQVN